MAKYFPIMLNIEHKKCIVIGGGGIAYRKCIELIQCGGEVTVVSKEACEMLRQLADKREIVFVKACYRKEHINGAFLVIAATDDCTVNEQIYRECADDGILVNVVDDPAHCSFIVPAKIRRGDLTIAVSTNGKSPMLSRRIREELENQYDNSYAILIEALGDMRQEIMELIPSQEHRKAFYERITSKEYLDKVRGMELEQVRCELRHWI